MNARICLLDKEAGQPDGVVERTSYLWDSCFGRILIETDGDQVFVNGDLVESAAKNETTSSK